LRQTRKFEEVSSRKKIKAAGPVSRILKGCFSQVVDPAGFATQISHPAGDSRILYSL
jgi:hypothetical protein